MCFWSVYPEFTQINCVQQAPISTWVSLSTFARWQHSYVLLLLAGGDTAAPSGLYARLCHAFLVFLICFMYKLIADSLQRMIWCNFLHITVPNVMRDSVGWYCRWRRNWRRRIWIHFARRFWRVTNWLSHRISNDNKGLSCIMQLTWISHSVLQIAMTLMNDECRLRDHHRLPGCTVHVYAYASVVRLRSVFFHSKLISR